MQLIMASKIKTTMQLTKERAKRIPFVRLAMSPYMNRKFNLMDEAYRKSEDAACIRSLKGSGEGKRCFVVGNGPSLTPDDLDLISSEVSFAANGAFHMFGKTEWRPTYYISVDRNFLALHLDEILSQDLPRVFLESYIANRVKEKPANVSFLNLHLKHFDKRKFTTSNIDFSEDISTYICSGYTVTYAMIQMAVYMGFEQIYLLGIDHTYGRAIDSSGRIETIRSGNDHFFRDGGTKGYYYYEGVEYAYRLARQAAENRGSSILNATRGGALELFPRVDLDCIVG